MSKQARITADSHSLKYYAEKILDVYNSKIKKEENKNFFEKLKETLKK